MIQKHAKRTGRKKGFFFLSRKKKEKKKGRKQKASFSDVFGIFYIGWRSTRNNDSILFLRHTPKHSPITGL